MIQIAFKGHTDELVIINHQGCDIAYIFARLRPVLLILYTIDVSSLVYWF